LAEAEMGRAGFLGRFTHIDPDYCTAIISLRRPYINLVFQTSRYSQIHIKPIETKTTPTRRHLMVSYLLQPQLPHELKTNTALVYID
ncbi:MAG TPA: hypothetical protein ACQGQU_09795, partial [Xylella fastidiosa subsp. multiplex]